MQVPDNWDELDDEEKRDFIMSRADPPTPQSEIPPWLAFWAIGNGIYWFYQIGSWLNGSN